MPWLTLTPPPPPQTQVSGHGGGRRQEAQRMGRILRPKSAAAATAAAATAAANSATASAAAAVAAATGGGGGRGGSAATGGDGGGGGGGSFGSKMLARGRGGPNEAQFYTLISRDTHEMVTGTKRQEYLVDQGYTYRVMLEEELTRGWDSPTCPKGSQREEQMLAEVVLAIEEGRGGVDKRGGKPGTTGRGGGRGSGGRGGGGARGGWGGGRGGGGASSSSSSVVPSKYTQPGRHALMKWKQKKKTKPKQNQP